MAIPQWLRGWWFLGPLPIVQTMQHVTGKFKKSLLAEEAAFVKDGSQKASFYSRIILTTSAPRILFIWSIVFHSKFWHGQQANFSACTGCSIMSHIATAPQTMQQTSVQKSQDLQNPTATSIKSHCQSLLLRGMAPRSIFSGSPVVYQEAPLQFPFANSPKDFWRKAIQTPQIHNKNEKKKVRPCLCHCGRPQHARFTKHCDGFVVRYALVYLTIFQFPVAGASWAFL